MSLENLHLQLPQAIAEMAMVMAAAIVVKVKVIQTAATVEVEAVPPQLLRHLRSMIKQNLLFLITNSPFL